MSEYAISENAIKLKEFYKGKFKKLKNINSKQLINLILELNRDFNNYKYLESVEEALVAADFLLRAYNHTLYKINDSELDNFKPIDIYNAQTKKNNTITVRKLIHEIVESTILGCNMILSGSTKAADKPAKIYGKIKQKEMIENFTNLSHGLFKKQIDKPEQHTHTQPTTINP